MTEPSADELRRAVDEKRRAFERSLDAVAVRVERGSARVEGALVHARDAADRGRALVARHPMVFVAAAVGVGLALGLARPGRRAALAAPAVAAAPKPSLLWRGAGFLARMALRGIVSSVGASARRPPADGAP